MANENEEKYVYVGKDGVQQLWTRVVDRDRAIYEKLDEKKIDKISETADPKQHNIPVINADGSLSDSELHVVDTNDDQGYLTNLVTGSAVDESISEAVDELNDELDIRLDGIEANIASLDERKIEKVSNPTTGGVPVLNENGYIDDSGKTIMDSAPVDTHGDIDYQTFNENIPTGKAVTDVIADKIDKLDVPVTELSASETVSAISESNGKISVTKQDIAIVSSQVTDRQTTTFDGTAETLTTGKAVKAAIDALNSEVTDRSTNVTVTVTETAGKLTGITVSDTAATSDHVHGRISNDGKIGETADLAVVTGASGAVTVADLTTDSPVTSALEVIDSVSQDSRGKISATKKELQGATTEHAGVVQLVDSYNDSSLNKAPTANALKSAYEHASQVIADLDVDNDLGNGEYITTLGQTDGLIHYTKGTMATWPAHGGMEPITSGGAHAAIQEEHDARVSFDTRIESYLPDAVSNTNKLADKAYVDAIGERLEARYLASSAENDLPFPTKAAFDAAQAASPQQFYYEHELTTPDNNDVVVITADESKVDQSTTGVAPTTRYRYIAHRVQATDPVTNAPLFVLDDDGQPTDEPIYVLDGNGDPVWEGSWYFEYVINNSALNQDQLLAINSGITPTKRVDYDAHVYNLEPVQDEHGTHYEHRNHMNPHGTTYTQVMNAEDGLDTTAAELQKLHGAVITTGELNTLKGISTENGSTVQKQLDSKANRITGTANHIVIVSDTADQIYNTTGTRDIKDSGAIITPYYNSEDTVNPATGSAIKQAIDDINVTDEPVTHQFVTGVSETAGEISVTRAQPVIGDVDGLTDALADIDTGKANKVEEATEGNLAGLDENGDLTDSGIAASQVKLKQNAVPSPEASGNSLSFIDTVEQNANGEITATKKTVPLQTTYTGGNKEVDNVPVTASAVTDALETLDSNVTATGATASIQVSIGQTDGKLSSLTVDDSAVATKTYVDNKIDALDVEAVGGEKKYIVSIEEVDGKIHATPGNIAETITESSDAPASSKAVYNKIGTLNHTEERPEHNFVTNVTETAGIIDVEFAQPGISDISGLSSALALKADRDLDAVANDIAVLDANGNPVDSDKHIVDQYRDTEKSGDAQTAEFTGNIPTGKAVKELVDETLNNTVSALDAEVTSSDGTNVQVKVTEVDGKITGVNVTTDNTINNTNLTDAINALDAVEESSDGNNVQVKVTEVDGKITAVNVTTDNTVNETDLNSAISSAVNSLDADLDVPAGKYITNVFETDGVVDITTADMDTTPTANSTKPVTSGGVKSYVDSAIDALDTTATVPAGEFVSGIVEQNGIVSLSTENMDATPTAGSKNPVTSEGIKSYVDNSVNSLDYTDTAVDHQFVTGVSETDGVISVSRAQPTVNDISGLADKILEITEGKANKVSGATADNLATLSATGDLVDSTKHIVEQYRDTTQQTEEAQKAEYKANVVTGTAVDQAIKEQVDAMDSRLLRAIQDLDAEEVSTDGTNVQVKVKEVDGKITAVNVTTDNTINSGDLTNRISALDADLNATGGTNVGLHLVEEDGVVTGLTLTDNTINNTDLTNAINALDAEKTSTDGRNVQVKVTEVDGKITAVNVTTDNTVNATDVSTAITSAIEDLDVAQVGGAGKYIKAIKEDDGKITATVENLDTVVTAGSNVAVTSDAVATKISGLNHSENRPEHNFVTNVTETVGVIDVDFAQPAFTDISGVASVAQGGTGATSAAGARSNLDVYSTGEVDSRISGHGKFLGKRTPTYINNLNPSDLHNSDSVICSADGTITLGESGSFPVQSGEELILFKDDSVTPNVIYWQSVTGNYKRKQDAVDSTQPANDTFDVLTGLHQNANGEVTVDRTSLTDATQSLHGLMKATDKAKLDALDTQEQLTAKLAAKADKVTGQNLNGHLAGLDANGNLTDSGKAVTDNYSATGTDPVTGTAVKKALDTLDSTATSTDGTNVQVKVTETDGKITAVNITKDDTATAAQGAKADDSIRKVKVQSASGTTTLVKDSTDDNAVTVDLSGYKPLQTPVSSSTADTGSTLTFVSSVTQNAQGVITPKTKTVTVDSTYSSVGTNPVNGTAIADALDTLDATVDTTKMNDKIQLEIVQTNGKLVSANWVVCDIASGSQGALADTAVQVIKLNGSDVAKAVDAETGLQTVNLGNLKTKQTAVEFTGAATKTIDKVTQNANGEVVVTFRDIQSATTSQKGIVQLAGSIGATVSSENNKAATEKAVRDAIDALDATVTNSNPNNVTVSVTETNGKLTGITVTDTSASADHVHGNITNDGKIGETEDLAVVTGTSGAVTVADLTTADPAASGTTITAIATVSQDSKGKITATKKTIRSASTSQTGVVQLSSATDSSDENKAATPKAVKTLADSKADKVSGATNGNFAGLDANGNLTDSGKKASDFATSTQGGKADTAIQGVKVNGTELTKDSSNKVNVTAVTGIKGSTESSYRTGQVELTAGNVGAYTKGETDTLLNAKENVANKKTTIDPDSDTDYPTSKAVATLINSSVATATATHLGTFSVSDIGLSGTPTNAQIATALDGHTWPTGVTPTNNDYVYIEINSDPATTIVDEYRRFKFDGTEWGYEYTLNNSSYTQAQWDAINSGITATDKGNYDSHIASTSNPHGVTKAQVGLGSVVNTGDSATPVAGGTTKFTTGGAYTELNKKADKVGTATENNFVSFDANGNIKDSGHKHSDYKTKQTAVTTATADTGSTLTFISSVTQDTNGVITPKTKTVTVDSTYSASGTNPVNGTAVAAALGTLDVPSSGTGAITGFGASKTLATLTETDGKIAATFQDIQIAESQVTNLTSDLAGKASSTHTHGNISNTGTLTDTAAAAAGNDYVVIRDATDNKVQTSTIKGTDVADAVSKKHSHSSLTLSTTAQAYDGSHTLALPSDDPYTSARTPTSHTHGNITNDGKVGSTANLALVTGTSGAVTTADLTTAAPTVPSSGTTEALEFIDSVSQDSKGKITATKKKVKIASTYSGTGTDPVNGTAVKAAIDALDATKTSTDGTNVQVKVTETDGKITAVNITTDNTASNTHGHGNITNDGKVGNTSGYAVYTTTGGAITAGSIAVAEPTASGTSTSFIATLSQDAKGQISATKANLPTASTSTAGIVQLSSSTSSSSEALAATPKAVKAAYDLASGKADKVSGATENNFVSFDANGNIKDSGKKAADFKTKQTAVTDPTASGNALSFIDTISQDANGVITATKKTVTVDTNYNTTSSNPLANSVTTDLAKKTIGWNGYISSSAAHSDLSVEKLKMGALSVYNAGVRIQVYSYTDNEENAVLQWDSNTVASSIKAKYNRGEDLGTVYQGSNGENIKVVYTGSTNSYFRALGIFMDTRDANGTAKPILAHLEVGSEVYPEYGVSTHGSQVTAVYDKASVTTATVYIKPSSTSRARIFGFRCLNTYTGVDARLIGVSSATTKLEAGRQLAVDLANTSTNSWFDGSVDQTGIKVSGTLGIANGGTGATDAATARSNLGVSSTSEVSTAITNAINALDVDQVSVSASETIKTIKEENGKIAVMKQSIGIASSQITDKTDTYSSTGTVVTTGKAIADALGTLDGSITGTPGASKTLTAFSETDGIVSATFGNISIPSSQINDKTDTYSATGTAVTTGKAIAAALGTLDGTVTGTPGTAKTLTAFSETDGKVSATFADIAIAKSQITDFPSTMPPSSHTHGNIQNGGTLQTTDVTIASGDKLVITDSSDSNKVARASISFDGSTATKALTQKGTWETFNNYTHPAYDTATAAAKKIGRDATGHVVIGDALTKADVGLGNVKNQAITVTSTSVSDGTNTFNKYTHPTYTEATAAAVKVGRDGTGHVVIGAALAKGDVGLGNVDNTSDATKKSNFTGSIANGNTGFVTGGAVYTALSAKQDTISWMTSAEAVQIWADAWAATAPA